MEMSGRQLEVDTSGVKGRDLGWSCNLGKIDVFPAFEAVDLEKELSLGLSSRRRLD